MNNPPNYFDAWLFSAKHSPCSLLPMMLPVTQRYTVGATLKRRLCLCSCYSANETSFVKKQCPWLKIVDRQASAVRAQQPRHYTDNRTENTYLQDDSVKSLNLVLFCSWSCFWDDSFYPSFITSDTRTCNALLHPLPFLSPLFIFKTG